VNIIISSTDIKFHEVLGVLKGVDKVGDKWWWIAILLGDVVQSSIILDGVKSSIFLLDKEERGSHWRIRYMDSTSMKVFINEGIELSMLMGQSIELTFECHVSPFD
jgi:hypothetical protein